MWADNPGIQVFNSICEGLYEAGTGCDNRIWSDGEKILVESEMLAENIADLIDAIAGTQVVVTGYYDPDDGEVDAYSGFYYVDIG